MNRLILAASTCLLLSAHANAATPKKNLSPAEQQQKDATYFKRFDKNSDGSVSKEEFVAQRTKEFDKEDTNHDGKLSQAEINASRQAKRARHDKRMAEKRTGKSSAPQSETPLAAPAAPAASSAK